MACALPHHLLFLFLLLFLLPFSIVAQTNGTVAVGTSITANKRISSCFPYGITKYQTKPLSGMVMTVYLSQLDPNA
ncbi:hypothetical protein ACSBR2_033844 [Camellia fascicularis]